MIIDIRKLFLLPALVTGLSLCVNPINAQIFTSLHSFSPYSGGSYTNYDGGNPTAGLILSGNTLYGTTSDRGVRGQGTIYRVNIDGSGFTNLYNFTSACGCDHTAWLTLSGNTLYGTASNGGTNSYGSVFALNTDGSAFTNLYNFSVLDPNFATNTDGISPWAGLVLSGNTLYGTTASGGSSRNGTIFAVNIDGSHFTNLYNFAATDDETGTNSDGAKPQAVLVISGHTLYGTAAYGGTGRAPVMGSVAFGTGTLFAINTDGTGFTNLHSFTSVSYNQLLNQFTNTDGANPLAGLILSGNTLYGTASQGGNSGMGTVFAINTDGSGFTNLHSVAAIDQTSGTNSEGAHPAGGLLLSGATLYGTTSYAGSLHNGTVFALDTDGSGFTNLYDFTGGDGGNDPLDGLVLSGNTLYGTTYQGGSPNNGMVFSLSFAPQLTIVPSGANSILTWPTNAAGFSYAGYLLQSTTNLTSTAAWTNVNLTPVINNGQYAVTNVISGAQMLYRLSSD